MRFMELPARPSWRQPTAGTAAATAAMISAAIFTIPK